MTEHIHSATDDSPENQATGLSPAGSASSPIAVGTFVLRRDRYFNETDRDARRADTAESTITEAAGEELQQAGLIRDPGVPSPGAKVS